MKPSPKLFAVIGGAAVAFAAAGCSHKTVIEDHRDDSPRVIERERVYERDHAPDTTIERRETTIERR